MSNRQIWTAEEIWNADWESSERDAVVGSHETLRCLLIETRTALRIDAPQNADLLARLDAALGENPTDLPMDPLSVIRRALDGWRCALMTDDELIAAMRAALGKNNDE